MTLAVGPSFRSSKKASAEEIAVVAAFLDDPGDPRAATLVEQVRTGRAIRRKVSGGSFVMSLGETTEALLVEVPSDVVSAWVPLQDSVTGRQLEFQVEVGRSGIFRCLRARSTQYRWPKRWAIEPAELDRVPTLALPPFARADHCVHTLERWLGTLRPRDGITLSCQPPATTEELAQLTAREGMRPPAGYRELLEHVNGLTIGADAILGTSDTYVARLDGGHWWVISDIKGTMYVVVGAGTAENVYLWPYDAPTRHGAHLLATCVAQYVRDSLAAGSLTGSPA